MPTVVLVDTNVWVSAFINPFGPPARLQRAWRENRFEVAVSFPLLDELADGLTRPRLIRKYPIHAADVEAFLRLLIQRSHIVAPTGAVQECRDPDDDLDLIEHLQAHRVTVLSVPQFLAKLDAGKI